MLFDGTLQQGIAQALQDSKHVVCFVTDGEDESQKWETEFLTEESIAPLIASQSVCLRLEAGSQEAGYLAQIYPIPKKPTLVVIKNAELKEYISASTTKADFIDRLKRALEPAEAASASEPPAAAVAAAVPVAAAAASASSSNTTGIFATPSSHPSPSTASALLHDESGLPSTTTTSTATTAAAAAAATSDRNARIRSLMAERAARLSAQRAQQAEEAAAAAAASSSAAMTNASRPPTAQTRHAAELKKRQRDAREERARILQAIEDDKAARRARQADRRPPRAASPTTTVVTGDKSRAQSRAQGDGGGGGGFGGQGPCHIQVRLFDGSTIRRRFDGGTDTLRGAVRTWVDGEAAAAAGGAYGFKVLLGPVAPNRAVAAEEEAETLAALGLAPSATLVLVPALGTPGKLARAYPRRWGKHAVARLAAYVLACVTGFFGLIAAFFSGLASGTGVRGAAPRAGAGRDAPAAEQVRVARASGREGRRGEQQFYNGNSTNFQPRHDEDDET
ncbi:hypothetical protein P8C59_009157 [Phyllachora maydis]|uniref:UBX domain-containing protein 2 n=1 Tax=Phyllachora maydis TaxID=1825666 RepID=A0AAD9IE32_9PEZI|nr:hypothetical protein P8C59_009157 [Phyllachora maydis]